MEKAGRKAAWAGVMLLALPLAVAAQTPATEPGAALVDSASQAAAAVIPDVFYDGWRVQQLIGQSVRGFQAEELGEIEDALVSGEGRITALVAKGGGFLGFGEAVFAIPWELVALTPGEAGVVVPVTKSTAEQRGLFGGPDTVAIGPGVRLVSSLIGRPVRFGRDTRFGVLLDLVFDAEGRATAAVVGRPSDTVHAFAEDADPPRWMYTDPDTERTIIVLPADAITLMEGVPAEPE